MSTPLAQWRLCSGQQHGGPGFESQPGQIFVAIQTFVSRVLDVCDVLSVCYFILNYFILSNNHDMSFSGSAICGPDWSNGFACCHR